MSDILTTIKQHKLEEIAAAKRRCSLDRIMDEAAQAEPARGFAAAIRAGRAHDAPRASGHTPRLIAEIKKASPSAGIIRDDFNPVAIAQAYETGGAAAISCLTDEVFFKGELDYLALIRAAVRLPILRKDFMLDPWQVWESRAAGADAILLIAGMIPWGDQAGLRQTAKDAGLDVLLEIHDADELEPALELGADLLGINNRNLRTRDLATDLATSRQLALRVPPHVTLVSESGIRNANDVRELTELGFDGILVGEHLMREPDPGAAIQSRLGIPPNR